MARRRLTSLNVAYTLIGLAVAGGIGYYAWRSLRGRGRREANPRTPTGSLMDARRSSRKVGRSTKPDAAIPFEDAPSIGHAMPAAGPRELQHS